MPQSHFDYIIAGAGSAGLSLAWHLIHSPLSNKEILVIDSDLQPRYDKTWCFWHHGTPPFEPLVTKSWSQADVHIQGKDIRYNLNLFPYYCIQSFRFKDAILAELTRHPSVELLEGRIEYLDGSDHKASATVDGKIFTADYIFQSCFIPERIQNANVHFPLRQHFLGWDIETRNNLFDPSTITLMDFDETFTDGLAFMYILPWSPHKALLEYTVFSSALRDASFYEKKLELYLFNKYKLKRLDYQIKRTEQGVIPMQDVPYVPWYAPRVLNMGVPGGLTKPSTGYTFTRIQKHVQAIVSQLLRNNRPAPAPRSSSRYRAYDLWLLQIMYNHPDKALDVFHDLFTQNTLDSLFRFLGEETSFFQDLKIMNSVPYAPFIQAIWHTRKRLTEI